MTSFFPQLLSPLLPKILFDRFIISLGTGPTVLWLCSLPLPPVPTKIHEHVHTHTFCTHCRLYPGVWVKACNRQHFENMSPHIRLEAILTSQSLREGDKAVKHQLSDMTGMLLRTIYQQNNAIRYTAIVNIFVIFNLITMSVCQTDPTLQL